MKGGRLSHPPVIKTDQDLVSFSWFVMRMQKIV